KESIEEFETIPGTVPRLINPPSGCRFHPRCEYAREVCKEERPDLEEIKKGHHVACHFWEEVE
ncbi:MAG: oligopeptide/dipeptide ABC transporter ATP-binding protein, partial [Candidatus Thermoplasmatota archaeon]